MQHVPFGGGPQGPRNVAGDLARDEPWQRSGSPVERTSPSNRMQSGPLSVFDFLSVLVLSFCLVVHQLASMSYVIGL